MSRRSSARVAAALTASALSITFAAVAAGPQDDRAAPAERAQKERQEKKGQAPPFTRDELFEEEAPWRDRWTTSIDKWFETYDLKACPLPPIPNDPPPHEGAMIGSPLVVDAPDLVQVEVLEALPGRPISGERLVRPDGTISLGFYGTVQVRGLTLPQVKVAVIKQLRKFLGDDVLGLRFDPPPHQGAMAPPELPEPANPFDLDEKPGGARKKAPTGPGVGMEEGRPRLVHPEDSTRVFVEITAYNSTPYYVTGDVVVPGKLPTTGKETVLDALQHAGGLLPTAEPRDIRLVRPARGGKPSRVYNIDLEAIQDKGDVRTNYQLFPGDRLVIGRNEVVKKTVEIDRLNAPIQAIVASIQQNANMLKSLGALSPERSDQVLQDLVDFWAREVSRKGELKFDEQKLREILLHSLKAAPGTPRTGSNPGSK